jgi:hypothetical protein
MSKQGTGDIPSLSTMSDLGAALPPGNGGTVSVYAWAVIVYFVSIFLVFPYCHRESLQA